MYVEYVTMSRSAIDCWSIENYLCIYFGWNLLLMYMVSCIFLLPQSKGILYLQRGERCDIVKSKLRL
jgi:hypothetical protein